MQWHRSLQRQGFYSGPAQLVKGSRFWHCHSCSTDSVPGQQTSICHRYSHLKKKKKKVSDLGWMSSSTEQWFLKKEKTNCSSLLPWENFQVAVQEGDPFRVWQSLWVKEIQLGVWKGQGSYSLQGRVPERRVLYRESSWEIQRVKSPTR